MAWLAPQPPSLAAPSVRLNRTSARAVSQAIAFVGYFLASGCAGLLQAQTGAVWVGRTESSGSVFANDCYSTAPIVCGPSFGRARWTRESPSAGVEWTWRESGSARLRTGVGVSRRGFSGDIQESSGMNTWFATVPLAAELIVPLGASRLDLLAGAGVAADIGLDYIRDSHMSAFGHAQMRVRLGSRRWGVGIRTTRSFRRVPNDFGDRIYHLRSNTVFLSTELALPRGR